MKKTFRRYRHGRNIGLPEFPKSMEDTIRTRKRAWDCIFNFWSFSATFRSMPLYKQVFLWLKLAICLSLNWDRDDTAGPLMVNYHPMEPGDDDIRHLQVYMDTDLLGRWNALFIVKWKID